MELGEKIKQARLEAGLSQRQLCGDHITRNMLSQIEHGTARPSMDTLRILAAGLGKPMSYFLEDEVVTSPNVEIMAQCREHFCQGDPAAAVETMENYRTPDPVFDSEAYLMRALCRMAQAEEALEQGRLLYGRSLLDQACEDGAKTPYYTPELERRRVILLARAMPEAAVELAEKLPSDDETLLLRAKAALAQGEPDRAETLLSAAQNRDTIPWQLLRGEVYFAGKHYAQAVPCFLRTEEAHPRLATSRLEVCYRELGDFKKAYEYACKQR